MTFDEAIEEFLQWLTIEKGRSRATLEAYRRDLGALARWATHRGLAFDRLREEDLEAYFNSLRASRRSTSVARTIAATRGLFSFHPRRGSPAASTPAPASWEASAAARCPSP